MGSGGGTSSGSEGAKRQDFRLKEQQATYGRSGRGGNLSRVQQNFERNITAAQQLERRAAEGSIKSPIPSIAGVAINTLGGFFNERLAGQLRTGSTSATPVTAKFGPSQNELVVGVVGKDGVYSGRQQYNPSVQSSSGALNEEAQRPDKVVEDKIEDKIEDKPEIVSDSSMGTLTTKRRRGSGRRISFGARSSLVNLRSLGKN